MTSRQSFRLRWMVLLVAFGVLAAAPAAGQSLTKRLTLDELTDQADAIFVAKCTRHETLYRDGNIVSRYRMKPSEFWKNGGMQLSSAGEMTIEQRGGSLEEPIPLTQFDPTSVQMTEGQEVLMFTRAPDAERQNKLALAGAAPPVLSPELPRIVGGNMGVYSVIRNPEDGRRLLAPGTAAGRLNEQTIGKAIAKNAQARQAAAAAPAESGPAPAAAAAATPDESRIRPFESLHDVKKRIQSKVSRSKAAEAAAEKQ